MVAFGSYRAYGLWRKRHLSQQAHDFFAQKDYQSAVLVARHVLQLDPTNARACRIMAEIAEQAGKRDAVSWREQLVALEPDLTENRLALVHTALRFGQFDLARRALDAVSESGRANVKYHELAGTLAIADKKQSTAEAEFRAALQLEPANMQLALNLATVQLASTDAATREKARTDMTRLAEQPPLRLEALRALTSEALSAKATDSAAKWAGSCAPKRARPSPIFCCISRQPSNRTPPRQPCATRKRSPRDRRSPPGLLSLG